MKIELHEATGTLPSGDTALATRPDGSKRFRGKLIEGDRWGSSCYYPADVIKRDGPTLFAQGTQMYLDHPTESEQWQQPERSVLKLAGRIDSTPVWEDAGPEGPGLYSDVVVHAHHAPVVEALWKDIGLSIIAAAEFTQGERDGRSGKIATKLIPGQRGTSVDFVTNAGAGGALVSLMESARHAAEVDADQVAEALPGDLTGNELRDALRTVIRDAWREQDGYASLRDFTDSDVIFEVYYQGRDQLYRQAYAAGEDGALALTGTPEAVRAVTTYVPDPNAAPGQSTPPTVPVVGAAITESTTTPPGGITVGHVQIEESELSALREAQTQLAAERERTQVAERALAETKARNIARPLVAKVLESSRLLPASVQVQVVESVLAAAPPLTEQGGLDEAALTTLAEAARTAKETEAVALLEAHGVTGLPKGVGADTGSVKESAGGTGGEQGGGTVALTEASFRERVLAARGKAKATTGA